MKKMTWKQLKEKVRAGDVVFVSWPDLSKPNGIDWTLVKGVPLMEEIESGAFGPDGAKATCTFLQVANADEALALADWWERNRPGA